MYNKLYACYNSAESYGIELCRTGVSIATFYTSHKNNCRSKMKLRIVIVACAGYIFWQLFL